ncbi:MAG: protein kinase [Cyanobacteriota bacterium]|nr:protein kinase [Cyanobacteriota bacterium]
MTQCLNPDCLRPNPPQTKFCQSCGKKLVLAERYRALKIIGQGGFGRTFQAVDEYKPSKPSCVIKQFFPQAQGTKTLEKAAELFAQEAERLDGLGRHPQIPELFAYFTQDNRQYLVQEFIDGQNLRQELEESGAFDESQILELLKSLLPVLEFIHSQQVIHRDIKPENIIRRKNNNQFNPVQASSSPDKINPVQASSSPDKINPVQASSSPDKINPVQASSSPDNIILVDFGAAKYATSWRLLGHKFWILPECYALRPQCRWLQLRFGFSDCLVFSDGFCLLFLGIFPFSVFAKSIRASVAKSLCASLFPTLNLDQTCCN